MNKKGLDLQLFSSPSAGNLLLGAGMLYFDRLDKEGKSTGLRPLGNVTNFTITTTAETKKKYSSMQAARRLYASVATQISCTGKLTLSEYDPANLALAMLGEDGVYTQTEQTGLTKTFNSVMVGRLYGLGQKKVSNVVLESVPAGATYVEGVDYQIDLNTGYFEPLIGGAINDSSTISAKFDTQTGAFPKVSGGTVGQIMGMLYFKGDPTAGPAYEVEIWRASVVPEGDLIMITDDWGSFDISLEIQDDSENHPIDPYFRYIKLK